MNKHHFFIPIFDNHAKELIKNAESSQKHYDETILELISYIKKRCAITEIASRYQVYADGPGIIDKYPVDDEGFAISFDPITQEKEFFECWLKYGIVVGKKIIPKILCESSIQQVNDIVLRISDGKCDFRKPETYNNIPKDSGLIPMVSRGFFEVYHDDVLAQLRQHLRLYLHYVLIWGRADLWTSFDRLGVKLPHHAESHSLPLHVDQNPLIHPGFKTVQGVLALSDCPIEKGTYVGVPGSRKYFHKYYSMAGPRGEYVELNVNDPIAKELERYSQPFPLRAGDIVSWDSRTSHSNTENISEETRYVAYISMGLAREDDSNIIKARKEAFESGIGSNVREALMHASKKMRYTDYEKLSKVRNVERLTMLGRLVYGQEKYSGL
jgi:hypothetical protein